MMLKKKMRKGFVKVVKGINEILNDLGFQVIKQVSKHVVKYMCGLVCGLLSPAFHTENSMG